MRYAGSCQPFQTDLQLVLPESSNSRATLERATRAHATAYVYACRAVNSACTQKRVFRTQAGIIRARTYIHTYIHTGWYNMGKVACQTGIICNAAVVVVVGLNYIVTLPDCSSLFHSLSFPISFSPSFSPSPSVSCRPFLVCSSCFFFLFLPRHQRSTLWSFPRRRSNRVAVFHRWVPSRSKDKWTAIMWKKPNASTSKLRNGVPKFSEGKNALSPPWR